MESCDSIYIPITYTLMSNSELPKNTIITVQYKEHDNGVTETKTYELFVVKDKVTCGNHETIVDPDLTAVKVFMLRYRIPRDGAIRCQNQSGIRPSFLGYEHGETISDLKIIAIDTYEKVRIWRANHTGFQPQKIW